MTPTETRELLKETVNKHYEKIKYHQDELANIRSTICSHDIVIEGNYSWRPGAIHVGGICDTCGSFLGAMKSSKEWLEIMPKEWNLKILDHDGWNKCDWENSWGERIVRSEFIKRLKASSIKTSIHFTNIQ